MEILYDKIPLPSDFPFALSDMKLAPFYSMSEHFHWHDCFELSFVKSGNGVYEVEQRRYEMTEGDLIILNNVEPHRMYVGKEGMNQLVLIFNPSLIWSGTRDQLDYEYIKAFVERRQGFNNHITKTSPYYTQIRALVGTIESEFNGRLPGWRLMIKAQLLTLLTLLYRHFRTDNALDDSQRALLRLRPVLHRIEESFSTPVSFKDMADLLHITPRHFCVVFKEGTGQTFTDYLLTKRIAYAGQALSTTDRGITEIAYSSGFRNLSYFNKACRTKTGMTPSQFRRTRSACDVSDETHG